MLFMKGAKSIIFTYILFIIGYAELILSESFGKFQSSLRIIVRKDDGNYLSEYKFQDY